MSQRIVFENSTTFQCPNGATIPVENTVYDRDWRRISVSGVYADILANFVNNAVYRLEWDSELDGQLTVEQEDLSSYCVAGDIVDKRNGVFWVYMGKKTQKEIDDALIQDLMVQALNNGGAV